MNINTTGITIDGKTYRNLPEQVAYNKERIEELMMAAETGLLTFDWTVGGWISLTGSHYYYGILPDTFKAGRRYLFVVPLYDNNNSAITQFFSINSITRLTDGTNYVSLYAYGTTVPTSITFRIIDLGVDANEDITLPNITIVNHASRVQPTSYYRTLTIPGSSWTSDVNTVKFNLGQLKGGYHIQLIPADVETIDYIQNYYIVMKTPVYTFNGANTSITFKHNDGDYSGAPDLNFVVILTPVASMTKQYITMATNGNQ